MDFPTLRVPRALDGLEPLVLDMSIIYLAEARQPEIASVNHIRAQELMSFYNQAYLKASRYYTLLDYEYQMAESRLADIKAIITIDKLVGILKEKGLWSPKSPTGSEEIREAIFNTDPEYIKTRNNMINIKAHLKMMQNYMHSFEMSYSGAKKMVGDNGFLSSKPNPNLSLSDIQETEFNKTRSCGTDSIIVLDDFFGEIKK